MKKLKAAIDNPAVAADGAIDVTEAGRRRSVNLADCSRPRVAADLALPEGLTQTPWGTFIVAGLATQRLTTIDPATGIRSSVYVSADLNNAIYRIRPTR